MSQKNVPIRPIALSPDLRMAPSGTSVIAASIDEVYADGEYRTRISSDTRAKYAALGSTYRKIDADAIRFGD